jgi:hypothetical protein
LIQDKDIALPTSATAIQQITEPEQTPEDVHDQHVSTFNTFAL